MSEDLGGRGSQTTDVRASALRPCRSAKHKSACRGLGLSCAPLALRVGGHARPPWQIPASCSFAWICSRPSFQKLGHRAGIILHGPFVGKRLVRDTEISPATIETSQHVGPRHVVLPCSVWAGNDDAARSLLLLAEHPQDTDRDRIQTRAESPDGPRGLEPEYSQPAIRHDLACWQGVLPLFALASREVMA